jgi:hypothetical protein
MTISAQDKTDPAMCSDDSVKEECRGWSENPRYGPARPKKRALVAVRPVQLGLSAFDQNGAETVDVILADEGMRLTRRA